MDNTIIEDMTLLLNQCLLDVRKTSAIGYMRVSNKGLEKEFDAQSVAIKEYCNKHNIVLKDIISDIGSAYYNSKKLTIYDIIENNSNISLIITKPKIISRNIVTSANILDKCIKNNITIHIIDGDYMCNMNENNKRFLCDTYDAMMESKTNKIRKVTSIPFGMMESNNTITELPRAHIEQRTIDIIDMLYYGCNMNDFYELFNSLHNSMDVLGSDSHPFRDYKMKVYIMNDFKKGFSVGTIVGLLNDWNIMNRNKKWTNASINKIVDAYLEPPLESPENSI